MVRPTLTSLVIDSVIRRSFRCHSHHTTLRTGDRKPRVCMWRKVEQRLHRKRVTIAICEL